VSYVGQTKRKQKTRINEHKNNIRLDSSKHSVIFKHIEELDHNFDWTNLKILDIKRTQKRLISEIIHIKSQKYGINAQEDTELLDIIQYHKTAYWFSRFQWTAIVDLF